jgi:lipopolysaccharide transport system ATP-binding protein
MNTVISAKGVAKSYLIRHEQRPQYLALRDVLAANAKNFAYWMSNRIKGRAHRTRPSQEEFWALRGVDLEISAGARVGIIGRNGAGKSTLLKILSRITEPTAGEIRIRGRVASLLEVGTGFHPELTGRENIYVNGAVLGMTRQETRRKFDEIVSFAEIERFLDTPVKRYSSGMYVRLAFAVAAHLEPEILLVDEVLAVGDAQFQRKCLGRMEAVAKSGRTVVFVSHNLTSITELCDSAIWLESGCVRSIDESKKAVQAYLASGLSPSEGSVSFEPQTEHKAAYLNSVVLRNEYGEITSKFDVLKPISVDVRFTCNRRFLSWRIFASVTRYDGITVFSTTTWDYQSERPPIDPGSYQATLTIPGRFLAENRYLLTVAFGEPPEMRHDVRENILDFEITGQAFDYKRNIGILAYPFEWKIEKA